MQVVQGMPLEHLALPSRGNCVLGPHGSERTRETSLGRPPYSSHCTDSRLRCSPSLPVKKAYPTVLERQPKGQASSFPCFYRLWKGSRGCLCVLPWTHCSSLVTPSESESWSHSCIRLCDPKDCSLPGSSVYGILQVRVLKWTAISSPRGSFRSRDWTQVSFIAGRFFTNWTTREAQKWDQTLIWSPDSCSCHQGDTCRSSGVKASKVYNCSSVLLYIVAYLKRCGLQVQLLISLKLRANWNFTLWNTHRSWHTFNNWELWRISQRAKIITNI